MDNSFETVFEQAQLFTALNIEDEEEEVLVQEIAHSQLSTGRGSRAGRKPNIERNFPEANQRFYNDYFALYPTYDAKTFLRRYRMPREMYVHISSELARKYQYFQQRSDAAHKLGLSTMQKCTVALRMLAYGASADSLDENLRVGKSTSLEILRKFCEGITELFASEYLRSPNPSEISKLRAENSERGFPGMVGSIDCMHWRWKNCPSAWKGQFQGKGQTATIVLEVVASKNCYIWHSFFGCPGTNNDLNVLYRSPLIAKIVKENFLGPPFSVGDHLYETGYLLGDGIYPDYPVFVKTVKAPKTAKQVLFAKHQEGVRKDVERCFGILQGVWRILQVPCRLWDRKTMSQIMETCIILHNMRIRYMETETQELIEEHNAFFEQIQEPLPEATAGFASGTSHIEQMFNRWSSLIDKEKSERLQADLINHQWDEKGNN
ncbi:uncharacterized protein LOC129752840 [Uranotaenia lowii]|uniref:uncharacterized protein LOC129742464 n=1 Tax=Uranotaenia lowii TaxID=190385 RepID=UPI002479B2E5|nr:uncharacterized protein LOC129742464 [Uranotaenia lowii]XP_055604598.1 uncharacterized protein LOC129752840 [Uranotaenia lowii]